MKATTPLLLSVLAAGLVTGGCGGGFFIVMPAAPHATEAAEAKVELDPDWKRTSNVPHVSVFYDALAPYGTWEEDAGLGWVWTPSDAGYAPYARGRWVETEAGPTFLAAEPFGWAVAHYGRWFWRDAAAGSGARGRWSWLPGTRWGPAWVAWRVGPEHVGWRPLPPEGWSRSEPDHAWRFVPAREFIGPPIDERAYGLRDVPWLVASSRPHTQRPDAAFVVGPEVRYAGWRARKIALGRLPPGQVRWVPRWERDGELRPLRRSIRVGPAAPERRARKAFERGH